MKLKVDKITTIIKWILLKIIIQSGVEAIPSIPLAMRGKIF